MASCYIVTSKEEQDNFVKLIAAGLLPTMKDAASAPTVETMWNSLSQLSLDAFSNSSMNTEEISERMNLITTFFPKAAQVLLVKEYDIDVENAEESRTALMELEKQINSDLKSNKLKDFKYYDAIINGREPGKIPVERKVPEPPIEEIEEEDNIPTEEMQLSYISEEEYNNDNTKYIQRLEATIGKILQNGKGDDALYLTIQDIKKEGSQVKVFYTITDTSEQTDLTEQKSDLVGDFVRKNQFYKNKKLSTEDLEAEIDKTKRERDKRNLEIFKEGKTRIFTNNLSEEERNIVIFNPKTGKMTEEGRKLAEKINVKTGLTGELLKFKYSTPVTEITKGQQIRNYTINNISLSKDQRFNGSKNTEGRNKPVWININVNVTYKSKKYDLVLGNILPASGFSDVDPTIKEEYINWYNELLSTLDKDNKRELKSLPLTDIYLPLQRFKSNRATGQRTESSFIYPTLNSNLEADNVLPTNVERINEKEEIAKKYELEGDSIMSSPDLSYDDWKEIITSMGYAVSSPMINMTTGYDERLIDKNTGKENYPARGSAFIFYTPISGVNVDKVVKSMQHDVLNKPFNFGRDRTLEHAAKEYGLGIIYLENPKLGLEDYIRLTKNNDSIKWINEKNKIEDTYKRNFIFNFAQSRYLHNRLVRLAQFAKGKVISDEQFDTLLTRLFSPKNNYSELDASEQPLYLIEEAKAENTINKLRDIGVLEGVPKPLTYKAVKETLDEEPFFITDDNGNRFTYSEPKIVTSRDYLYNRKEYKVVHERLNDQGDYVKINEFIAPYSSDDTQPTEVFKKYARNRLDVHLRRMEENPKEYFRSELYMDLLRNQYGYVARLNHNGAQDEANINLANLKTRIPKRNEAGHIVRDSQGNIVYSKASGGIFAQEIFDFVQALSEVKDQSLLDQMNNIWNETYDGLLKLPTLNYVRDFEVSSKTGKRKGEWAQISENRSKTDENVVRSVAPVASLKEGGTGNNILGEYAKIGYLPMSIHMETDRKRLLDIAKGSVSTENKQSTPSPTAVTPSGIKITRKRKSTSDILKRKKTIRTGENIDYNLPNEVTQGYLDSISPHYEISLFKEVQDGTVGYVTKDIFALHTNNGKVSERFLRHELFHKIVNESLSPDQKERLFEEGREIMDDSYYGDVEEYLADLYENSFTEGNKIVKGIYNKVKGTFIETFFNWLRNLYLNYSSGYMNSVFTAIDNGMFVTANAKYNNYGDIPKRNKNVGFSKSDLINVSIKPIPYESDDDLNLNREIAYFQIEEMERELKGYVNKVRRGNLDLLYREPLTFGEALDKYFEDKLSLLQEEYAIIENESSINYLKRVQAIGKKEDVIVAGLLLERRRVVEVAYPDYSYNEKSFDGEEIETIDGQELSTDRALEEANENQVYKNYSDQKQDSNVSSTLTQRVKDILYSVEYNQGSVTKTVNNARAQEILKDINQATLEEVGDFDYVVFINKFKEYIDSLGNGSVTKLEAQAIYDKIFNPEVNVDNPSYFAIAFSPNLEDSIRRYLIRDIMMDPENNISFDEILDNPSEENIKKYLDDFIQKTLYEGMSTEDSELNEVLTSVVDLVDNYEIPEIVQHLPANKATNRDAFNAVITQFKSNFKVSYHVAKIYSGFNEKIVSESKDNPEKNRIKNSVSTSVIKRMFDIKKRGGQRAVLSDLGKTFADMFPVEASNNVMYITIDDNRFKIVKNDIRSVSGVNSIKSDKLKDISKTLSNTAKWKVIQATGIPGEQRIFDNYLAKSNNNNAIEYLISAILFANTQKIIEEKGRKFVPEILANSVQGRTTNLSNATDFMLDNSGIDTTIPMEVYSPHRSHEGFIEGYTNSLSDHELKNVNNALIAGDSKHPYNKFVNPLFKQLVKLKNLTEAPTIEETDKMFKDRMISKYKYVLSDEYVNPFFDVLGVRKETIEGEEVTLGRNKILSFNIFNYLSNPITNSGNKFQRISSRDMFKVMFRDNFLGKISANSYGQFLEVQGDRDFGIIVQVNGKKYSLDEKADIESDLLNIYNARKSYAKNIVAEINSIIEEDDKLIDFKKIISKDPNKLHKGLLSMSNHPNYNLLKSKLTPNKHYDSYRDGIGLSQLLLLDINQSYNEFRSEKMNDFIAFANKIVDMEGIFFSELEDEKGVYKNFIEDFKHGKGKARVRLAKPNVKLTGAYLKQLEKAGLKEEYTEVVNAWNSLTEGDYQHYALLAEGLNPNTTEVGKVQSMQDELNKKLKENNIQEYSKATLDDYHPALFDYYFNHFVNGFYLGQAIDGDLYKYKGSVKIESSQLTNDFRNVITTAKTKDMSKRIVSNTTPITSFNFREKVEINGVEWVINNDALPRNIRMANIEDETFDWENNKSFRDTYSNMSGEEISDKLMSDFAKNNANLIEQGVNLGKNGEGLLMTFKIENEEKVYLDYVNKIDGKILNKFDSHDGTVFKPPLFTQLARNSMGNEEGVSIVKADKLILNNYNEATGDGIVIKGLEVEMGNFMLKNGNTKTRSYLRAAYEAGKLNEMVYYTYDSNGIRTELDKPKYKSLWDVYWSANGWNGEGDAAVYNTYVEQQDNMLSQPILLVNPAATLKKTIKNINPLPTDNNYEFENTYTEDASNLGYILTVNKALKEDNDVAISTQLVYLLGIVKDENVNAAKKLYDILAKISNKELNSLFRQVKSYEKKYKLSNIEAKQKWMKDKLRANYESSGNYGLEYALTTLDETSISNPILFSQIFSIIGSQISRSIQLRANGFKAVQIPVTNIIRKYTLDGKILLKEDLESMGIDSNNLPDNVTESELEYAKVEGDKITPTEVITANPVLKKYNLPNISLRQLFNVNGIDIEANNFQDLQSDGFRKALKDHLSTLTPNQLIQLPVYTNYLTKDKIVKEIGSLEDALTALDNSEVKLPMKYVKLVGSIYKDYDELKKGLNEKLEEYKEYNLLPDDALIQLIEGTLDKELVPIAVKYRDENLNVDKLVQRYIDINRSLYGVMSRIPGTAKNSSSFFRIVAFSNEYGNGIFTPAAWLKISGSDHDGDTLQLWMYDEQKRIKGKNTSSYSSEALDVAVDILSNPNNFDEIYRPLETEEVENDAAKQDVSLKPFDVRSFLEIKDSNSAGTTMTGAHALGGKAYSYAFQSASKLRQEMKKMPQNVKEIYEKMLSKTLDFPGEDKLKLEGQKLKATDTNDNYIHTWIELLINAAVDNAKLLALGAYNLSLPINDYQFALTMLGVSKENIKSFLTSKGVKEVMNKYSSKTDLSRKYYTSLNRFLQNEYDESYKYKGDNPFDDYQATINFMNQINKYAEEYSNMNNALKMSYPIKGIPYEQEAQMESILKGLGISQLSELEDLVEKIEDGEKKGKSIFENPIILDKVKNSELYPTALVSLTFPHMRAFLKSHLFFHGLKRNTLFYTSPVKRVYNYIETMLDKNNMSKSFNKNKLWKEFYKYVNGKFLDTQVGNIKGVEYKFSDANARLRYMEDFAKYLTTVDKPFVKLLRIEGKQIKFPGSHTIGAKEYDQLLESRRHFRELPSDMKKQFFLYSMINNKQGLEYAARDGMVKFFDNVFTDYNSFLSQLEKSAIDYSNGKLENADFLFTTNGILNFLNVFGYNNKDLIKSEYRNANEIDVPPETKAPYVKPALDAEDVTNEFETKKSSIEKKFNKIIEKIEGEIEQKIEAVDKTTITRDEYKNLLEKIRKDGQTKVDEVNTQREMQINKEVSKIREKKEKSIGSETKHLYVTTYTEEGKVKRNLLIMTEDGYKPVNLPFDNEVNIYSDKFFLPLEGEWNEDFTKNVDGKKITLAETPELAALDIREILKSLNDVIGGIGSYSDTKAGLEHRNVEEGTRRGKKGSKLSFNMYKVSPRTKLEDLPLFQEYILKQTESNSIEEVIEKVNKGIPYNKVEITLNSTLEEFALITGLNSENTSSYMKKRIANYHSVEKIVRSQHQNFDTLPEAQQQELIEQYKNNCR